MNNSFQKTAQLKVLAIVVAGAAIIGGGAFLATNQGSKSLSVGREPVGLDSADYSTMVENIKEKFCARFVPCANFSGALYSTGKTKGLAAKIITISWEQIFSEGKRVKCAYVHFTNEPGFDVYQHIITGNGSSPCAGTQGCFGCGGKSFKSVVKASGYDGKIPD